MITTRNTIRADGLTVGQAMDKDAADLRALGFHAEDGQPTLDERREELIEKCRKAVLDALDSVADEMTANRNDGPKDGELGKLFEGVDPIAKRIFEKTMGF